MTAHVKPPEDAEPTLTPDLAAIEQFLESFEPVGPWYVNSIDGKRKVRGKRFLTARALRRAGPSIRTRGAATSTSRSAPLAINPLEREEKPSPKANEDDILESRWLWVDIDPKHGADLEGERARILALIEASLPAPTLVIDSGGGFWALWRLAEPIPKMDGKARNAALRDRFEGGANCHNVDRICRLPYTVNWPDTRKVTSGRRPALARVVGMTGELHDPAAFLAAEIQAGEEV
jgi:hypothetical protein